MMAPRGREYQELAEAAVLLHACEARLVDMAALARLHGAPEDDVLAILARPADAVVEAVAAAEADARLVVGACVRKIFPGYGSRLWSGEVTAVGDHDFGVLWEDGEQCAHAIGDAPAMLDAARDPRLVAGAAVERKFPGFGLFHGAVESVDVAAGGDPRVSMAGAGGGECPLAQARSPSRGARTATSKRLASGVDFV